ncbi:MAG: response regulator [Gemmatimonadales bacterium]
MTRFRVLFVDDDPALLDGIRKMTRDRRDAWDMHFFARAEEGLAALTRDPFDVVVSDMRMPGMDGAVFLAEVRERSPRTVRVVLSGHAECEAVTAKGLAHQYLAKPCSAPELWAAVHQATRLRQTLISDQLVKVIRRLEPLPGKPAIFDQVQRRLAGGDASVDEIAAIVDQDPAMAAAILKLANSAWFAGREPVAVVARAVQLLGLETLSSVLLTAGIFADARRSGLPASTLGSIWEHTARTVLCARAIADSVGLPAPDRDVVPTVAVLHELGKLVLLMNYSDDYRVAFDRIAREGVSDAQIEREAIGLTHAEVGAYLLRGWRLPDSVVDAVGFHVDPLQAGAEWLGAAGVVHAADLMARALGPGLAPDPDWVYLERVGARERWDAWRAVCEAALER